MSIHDAVVVHIENKISHTGISIQNERPPVPLALASDALGDALMSVHVLTDPCRQIRGA